MVVVGSGSSRLDALLLRKAAVRHWVIVGSYGAIQG